MQWATLPLIDNHPDAQYGYEIHIYTGFKGESGTESNVKLTLVGEHGDTGIRWMTDGKRKV